MAIHLSHARENMKIHAHQSHVNVVWPTQRKPAVNSWIELQHGHSGLEYRKDKWALFEENYSHGRSMLRHEHHAFLHTI
jgi:hypothetical protein